MWILKGMIFDINQAFTKVKDRRKIVHPNSGFVIQLKTYEKKIKEIVAKSKE